MFEVVGIEKVNYLSKSGQEVDGVKVHLIYENGKIEGYGVSSEYISRAILERDIHVKDKIDLLYNRFGKVAKVEYIK